MDNASLSSHYSWGICLVSWGWHLLSILYYLSIVLRLSCNYLLTDWVYSLLFPISDSSKRRQDPVFGARQTEFSDLYWKGTSVFLWASMMPLSNRQWQFSLAGWLTSMCNAWFTEGIQQIRRASDPGALPFSQHAHSFNLTNIWRFLVTNFVSPWQINQRNSK